MDAGNIFLTILAVIAVLVGAWGTKELWNAYSSDAEKPRSWFLLGVSLACTVILVVGTYLIVQNTIRRLYGTSVIPEWASGLNVFALMLIICIPAFFAVLIRRNT